jgi:hypothetical protein
MQLEKIIESHKKLKANFKEQMHHSKDTAEKGTLDLNSKVEFLKTKVFNELEHLKDTVSDTLTQTQIEKLIKMHISEIKFPEIPPPQTIYVP